MRPLASREPGRRVGAEAFVFRLFVPVVDGAGLEGVASLRIGRLDLRARPVAVFMLEEGLGRDEAGPLTTLEFDADAGVRISAGTGGTYVPERR